MSQPALVVTGASGLIGSALGKLEAITPLRRGVGRARDAARPVRGEPEGEHPLGPPLSWDPTGGRVQDDGRLIGAVVHLAGESIASGRWTEARKRSMRDSRVLGTRTLASWLQGRTQRPEVFVSASAVGYYGDRGDEILDEDAGPGKGFLADLTAAWEEETKAIEALGVRVVRVRIGVVLSKEGGALEKMRLPFKLGAGGPIGSGRQWFPWVHLDDVVGILRWAIRTPSARGAYNAVAPGVVRQADFARALGRALHRPAVLPTPGFALRLAFGEMADEALLSSTRAVPRRLQEAGYTFRWPELEAALADVA